MLWSKNWSKKLISTLQGIGIHFPMVTCLFLFRSQVLCNMAALDDYDFSGTDAGASHVFNMEAGQIRVGG